MAMSTHPSICRFCSAYCGIEVDVEDGRPVRVRGDRRDPVYRGYSCRKGRQLPAQHGDPGRLLQPMKRGRDGFHRPIRSEQAMDEIAERISGLLERYGPRSVALYVGTYAGIHPTAAAAAVGWLLASGSRMVFTAASIDQPGKNIANAVHGRWLAGPYLFDEADAWLIVGANPLVSLAGGISPADSARRVRDATRRGLQLVVIDPRRSETARFAALHLQPRPGEDPVLLAAMIRVMLREGFVDEGFVAENADGFEALARAVAPFDPGSAARRAGVPAESIVRAARILGRARRGLSVAGTGPNMSGHGNLTEYLLLCMTTLRGHWRRAGEALPNPGVLMPPASPRAQPVAPRRAWGSGEKLRVRGLQGSAAGLPTAALADEMLLPGDGQVRALVCVGGNPVTAWPDPRKTRQALQGLELCVCLDIRMSATARLSDYVIPCRLPLEVPGFSLPVEAYEQSHLAVGYAEPYARYTSAVVAPPPGSDLLEEWELFYGLARRQGITLRLLPLRPEVGPLRAARAPLVLDMQRKPRSEELLERLAEGSRIPLAEVKKHPHGALFPTQGPVVAPRAADCDARLWVGDTTLLGQLSDLRGDGSREPAESPDAFPFRLVCRRLPDVYNSSGHQLPAARVRPGSRINPAWMHPADLEALGLSSGQEVVLRSRHGAIPAVVASAAELRRGVISMAHGFGEGPESRAGAREGGSNTGRLVSVEEGYDPYTGIPIMSGIPVAVEPGSA